MELTVIGFCLGLILLGIPLYIMYRFKVGLLSKVLMAFMKMLACLGLTGIFLYYVFEWDSVVVNILRFLLMTVVVSFTTLSKARLSVSKLIVPVLAATALSSLVFGLFFLFFVMGMKNPFDARCFIPVMGFLTGSMLEVNYKALSTYYMGLKYHQQLYYFLLGNGATHEEAVTSFLKRALEKTSTFYISRMGYLVVGLSPVVIWSMLLSGSSVIVAVEYQALLVIACFCTSMMALFATLWIARRYAFDEYSRLKNITPKNLAE